MPVPPDVPVRLSTAAKAAEEKGGHQILALNVGERLGLADAFLVVTGDVERQVEAIAEEIEETLSREHGDEPLRREGRGSGRWILLDYGDIVVHVQHVEERVFYALDRLWSDCPRIELNGVKEQSMQAPAASPADDADVQHEA